jgi:hypothetical protein
MHSALFVATIPKQEDAWETFLNRFSSKAKTTTAFVRLAENVWLIDLTKGAGPLGYLISFAHEGAIPYGILPFEHAPQWLPADFYPKPT